MNNQPRISVEHERFCPEEISYASLTKYRDRREVIFSAWYQLQHVTFISCTLMFACVHILFLAVSMFQGV